MMIMLTTQLAYNPSVSALAKPQERPNSSPTNTASAIGLVETDSYETGEQSPQVVGNPQARSGAHMSGVLFLILAGAAGFLVAQKPIREMLGDFFRKMTGGNHNESSHGNNSKFADNGESQPEVKSSRSDTLSTVAKKQRHNQHQELATA